MIQINFKYSVKAQVYNAMHGLIILRYYKRISEFCWSLIVLNSFFEFFWKNKLVFLNSRKTPKFLLLLFKLQVCVLISCLTIISILKKKKNLWIISIKVSHIKSVTSLIVKCTPTFPGNKNLFLVNNNSLE